MNSQDFINKRLRYAVIGATVNKEKYGYRVLIDMDRAGYSVVGVNPKYTMIEHIPVYATLADIPGHIDVAIFVVPPDIGLHLLPQVEEKRIQKIWFQPGAENDEVVLQAKKNGIETNDPGTCIMVTRHLVEGR